jgi:hypothetical protein
MIRGFDYDIEGRDGPSRLGPEMHSSGYERSQTWPHCGQ